MNVAMKTRSKLLGLGVSTLTSVALISVAGAWTAQPEPKKPEAPAAPAAAQPSEPLPKGEEVMDRYVKETGGKAAYESIKTLTMTGTLKMMPMGMEGSLKVQIARPAKLVSEVTIKDLGSMKSGSDGETVWSNNPFEGPKIVEGPEREMVLETSRISDEANWRERYSEVKCVGVEAVKGKPAYKMELKPKEGSKRTAFYDKESGLLVKQAMTMETPQGALASETFITDYKKVGELMLPHKTTMSMMEMEIITTFDKVEVNAEVPETAFALPKEVQELKDNKAKKAAEPKTDPKADPKTTAPAKPEKK